MACIGIILFLLGSALAAPLEQIEEVSLKIPQGNLIGNKGSYYSFKGIPYAEPPTGPLRFRAPRPHRGWSGNWDATKHGEECLQNTGTGSEDCLFLNVYTTSLEEKKPVMVWIYGGSYYAGSGDTGFYGPDYLVKKDVVIVTINYRLGMLGFFSTGDRHAQGNYGLKDCIEALHWVQENIKYFGGDPNKVTIFGESAGGALVNFLVFSPAARGLFHQAISQSGVSLSPWAYQPKPEEIAWKVAKQMNLRATTTEEIVRELRQIEDLNQFSDQIFGLETWDVPRYVKSFDFTPIVERDFAEPPAIIESPTEILRKGNWNIVPYMIGSNSHECLFLVPEIRDEPEVLETLNSDPFLLIPPDWNVTRGSPEATEVINAFQKAYFSGGPIKEELDYVDWTTDNIYHWPSYKIIERFYEVQTFPLYTYIFEYSSALNYVKHLSGFSSYPGAMHVDEIFYIWKLAGIPAPVLPGSKPDKVRQRMVEMWTNFAKFGDPTPEITPLITAKWPRVGENHEFMWIKEELEPSADLLSHRMRVWQELDKKYGP